MFLYGFREYYTRVEVITLVYFYVDSESTHTRVLICDLSLFGFIEYYTRVGIIFLISLYVASVSTTIEKF